MHALPGTYVVEPMSLKADWMSITGVMEYANTGEKQLMTMLVSPSEWQELKTGKKPGHNRIDSPPHQFSDDARVDDILDEIDNRIREHRKLLTARKEVTTVTDRFRLKTRIGELTSLHKYITDNHKQ